MNENVVVAVLFFSAAVSAAIAAFREDIFPKVQKTALAVCLAAAAFFIEASNFLGR